MKPHLFLFTLGPVQSFIAQARKTQDLYAGSRILADLVYAACRQAMAEGMQLIFPAGMEKDEAVPNRFLGSFAARQDAAEWQRIGQAVEDAVRAEFQQLVPSVLKNSSLNSRLSPQQLPAAFWEQIEQHLEINWLFHPMEDESEAAYRTAYQQIETFMGAVKNVRIFRQYTHSLPAHSGEAGRKCSLDGERNALIFGDGSNPRLAAQGIVVRNTPTINPNEGLSAVSFIKRFYPLRTSFPSTAEIAALNITRKNRGVFSVYKKVFTDDIDAQLFYKENLTERYLRKNGYAHVLEKTDLATIRSCWRAVFEGEEPSSYYALLAFDGDKMGKILSGDPEIFVGADLRAYQGEVSRLLTQFARRVATYFRDENPIAGAVVYTGGDDFLGFVNLEQLFVVMRWLRQAFHDQVNAELKKSAYFQEGFEFTFSAGIAIAHYKTPLSMVLDKARAMEKWAKSPHGGNRNAFALCVIKKSGESHEACYPWALDADMKHWKALEALVSYFEDGYCSENFVRTLGREFSLLQDDDGNITDKGMVAIELQRLVKRSLTEKGVKTVGMAEKILQTVENLMVKNQYALRRNFKLALLTEAISIALFIKRNRNKRSRQPQVN